MPADHSPGLSNEIRGELGAIQSAFDKCPPLAGNAGKAVIVNATGTGLTVQSSTSLVSANLARGTDLFVTASGVQVVSATGSYFVVVSAGGFSITGFTSTNVVRFFTLVLTGGLNLVDSATFRLRDRKSRRSIPGEIFQFTMETTGVAVERAESKVLDLSGYTGADISLGIGQRAFYDFAAVSSLPLRTAIGPNDVMSVHIAADFVLASPGVAYLMPNNLASISSFTNILYSNGVSALALSEPNTGMQLMVGGRQLHECLARVGNRPSNKVVRSEFAGSSAAENVIGAVVSTWGGATVWSSLGTLVFNGTYTGRVTIKREM